MRGNDSLSNPSPRAIMPRRISRAAAQRERRRMHDRVREHGDIGIARSSSPVDVDDQAQDLDHLLFERGAEFLDDGGMNGGSSPRCNMPAIERDMRRRVIRLAMMRPSATAARRPPWFPSIWKPSISKA